MIIKPLILILNSPGGLAMHASHTSTHTSRTFDISIIKPAHTDLALGFFINFPYMVQNNFCPASRMKSLLASMTLNI